MASRANELVVHVRPFSASQRLSHTPRGFSDDEARMVTFETVNRWQVGRKLVGDLIDRGFIISGDYENGEDITVRPRSNIHTVAEIRDIVISVGVSVNKRPGAGEPKVAATNPVSVEEREHHADLG